MSTGNVMLPELIWVEERCYRKLPIKYPPLGEGEEEPVQSRLQPSDYSHDDEPDCLIDSGPPVEEKRPGEFVCKVPVATDYRGALIGKAGSVKRSLEEETGTKLTFPERGKDGDIVISGPNRGAVQSARNRIQLKVHQERKRKPFTHFVSIPLQEDALLRGFAAFQEKVLGMEGAPVSAQAFQKPAKLHLTLGMLTIAGLRETEEAREAFTKAVERARERMGEVSGSLSFRLRGLEIMNDDPSAVDVLYAKVQARDGSEPRLLQIIGETIQKEMGQLSLFTRDSEPRLKLHATLLNSKLMSEGGGRGRRTFDARPILAAAADWDFGPFTLREIHLSCRQGASESSYYLPLITIPL